MCGISAYFNTAGASLEHGHAFLQSLKLIAHRGPDGEGARAWKPAENRSVMIRTTETPAGVEATQPVEESKGFNLFFGHRRLSIIDTSLNGHQPMQRGHLHLIFNGEIYNYVELKAELRSLGQVFSTSSDSEVLLVAYEQWGADCVRRFNGMFTFMIFDERACTLFVANDRFGVKPLYYYRMGTELIFVSEIKQLRAYALNLTVNRRVTDDFLAAGYIDTDEQTMFNEVSRFPKAHHATLDLRSGGTELKFLSYYQMGKVETDTHTVERFSEIFTDAVRIRLRSDVPLGLASSGGLDSSAILYRAHQLLSRENKRPEINAFSAVFPGMEGDESEFIRFIEKDLGISAHFCNPLEQFSIATFEKHIFHQDMPVASTSYFAEWVVAETVHKAGVKVLLIGQGGDELLAGYHHHFYRYCRQLILQGKILKYLALIRQYAQLKSVPVNTIHSRVLNEVKLAARFRMGLAKFSSKLDGKWNRANALTDLLKMDLTETMLPAYLRADDRDSMAWSIETRHPFLDYRLVDYSFSLPLDYKIRQGWQKWILREAMTEVPDRIRYRKDKKGYTTPERDWITTYKSSFENYLSYLPPSLRPGRDATFRHYALGAWFKVNNIGHGNL